MVKFIAVNGEDDKKLLCLGLTYDMLDNLRNGHSLSIVLGDLFRKEIKLKDLNPEDEIFLFADQSEEKILQELQTNFNIDPVSDAQIKNIVKIH